jgi:hypothetical protein
MNNFYNNDSKLSFWGWFLALSFVGLLALPRLVSQGMFADGINFSALALNLAEGRGTYFAPWFSQFHWLPYVRTDAFYEHPPGLWWIQSWFFKALGPHWSTEKIYCFVVLVLTVLVMNLLWKTVFKDDVVKKSLAWLPVFLWYLIPTINWGTPNNMLEVTMSLCCLTAILCVAKANNASSDLYFGAFLLMSGLFTTLAFCVKGVVGLFPLAAPFFSIHKQTLRRTLLSILPTTVFLLFFGAMWNYPPARNFWTVWFETQVASSIAGTREMGEKNWLGYLNLPIMSFFELLPSTCVLLLLIWLSRNFQEKKNANKTSFAWWFFLVFASAFFPLLISIKQKMYYAVPALPYLTMAGVAFFAVPLTKLFQKWLDSIHGFKYIKGVTFALLAGSLLYTPTQIGRIAREKHVFDTMNAMTPIFPDGGVFLVDSVSMADFVYHSYFMRFHRWEITNDVNLTKNALILPHGDSLFPKKLDELGFKSINKVVYQK